MTTHPEQRQAASQLEYPTLNSAGGILVKDVVELGLVAQEGVTESTDPGEIQKATFGTEFNPASHVESVESMVNVLAPYGEQAEDGTGRLIFTAGDVSFSFKSPEEYPLYPTQSQASTRLLAERSKRPTPNGDPFDDYKEQIVARTPDNSEGRHFTVDHTLSGVLDLAHELNPDDIALSHLRDEVKAGKYPERALLLLDALAAASYIDEAGNVTAVPNPYGDALVAMSLRGDVAAQTQVALRTARLHEHDAAKAQADHQVRAAHRSAHPDIYNVAPGHEAPKARDYMTVHATGHEPRRSEDGTIQLKTRFDTTGFSRPSLHFTLNHIVESHTYGNFDAAAYVVVAPLDKMIDANGKPKNLVGVDTWWNRNPGQPVECPGAVLVEPNDGAVDDLFVREGDSVKYKTTNFTERDVSQIVSELIDLEPTTLLHALPLELRDEIEKSEVGAFEAGSPLRERTIQSLLDAGQAKNSKGSQALPSLAKKLAVDKVLHEHDIKILAGDMWASTGEKSIRVLAGQLDVETVAHSSTPEYRMEQQLGEAYHPADPVTEDIAELDPESRRVMIASGIKAVRQPIKQTVDQDDVW